MAVRACVYVCVMCVSATQTGKESTVSAGGCDYKQGGENSTHMHSVRANKQFFFSKKDEARVTRRTHTRARVRGR